MDGYIIVVLKWDGEMFSWKDFSFNIEYISEMRYQITTHKNIFFTNFYFLWKDIFFKISNKITNSFFLNCFTLPFFTAFVKTI